uniref:Diamine acetyltransferase 2 n=1 Tax=Ascaris suum TaxID=6253 RepID=F1LG32_ASCSU
MKYLQSMVIERVEPKHASPLIFMIKELAEFEKMSNQVELSEDQLADDIRRGAIHGFIAFDNCTPLGMTLFYMAYSTWQGQFIHMEDLYVRPEYRQQGIGQRLWVQVAKLAHDSGMKRLQWNVLEWNENAIRFYNKVKAMNLTKEEGWLSYRLDGDGIEQLVKLGEH